MVIPETTSVASNLPVQGSTNVQERLQSIVLLTTIISVLSLFSILGIVFLLITYPGWQLGVLAGSYALTTLSGLAAYQYFYPRRLYFAGLLILGLMFGVTSLATAATLSGLGIPSAIVYLILALIISSMLAEEWQSNVIIGIGILVSGACALLTEFSPLVKLSIGLIDVLTPAILGILFMVYVVMLTMQFVMATMRIRLVTAFLAIVIIPLSVLTAIQSRFMFDVLDNETREGLRIAASQTALGIDSFFEDTRRSTDQVSQLEVLAEYLELPASARAGSTEEAEVMRSLDVLASHEFDNTVYLSSYGVIDLDGNTLYDTLYKHLPPDTDPALLAAKGIPPLQYRFEGSQDYFLVPARSGVSFVSTLQIPSRARSFFFVSAPVKNDRGQTVGVLRARLDGMLLQNLIERYSRLLGDDSFAILLDEHNIRLADAFTPSYRYKSVAPLPEATVRILQNNQRLPMLPKGELSTSFTAFNVALNNIDEKPFFSVEISALQNEGGMKEVGAVTRIETLPWKVVYLHADFSNDLLLAEQRRLSTLVTTAVAVLVAVIAVLIAQFLSSPIIKLTRTAQKISEGSLDAQAPENYSDEFGMLGSAFNSMTGQLRVLISELEERVKARTQEIEEQNRALTHRARQIHTVSDVARQIVSSQELETFLTSITRLVSERFTFYHVGIFLLDESKEYAVLRAANSEGGQRMLARRHMLPVGKVGIVGHATGTGEATIALDVGTDRIYFNNPDLPETRSEIALPLKVNNVTIGAIDIQSKDANAFQPDDIELFTILADQIAIAIHNNQLYTETVRALNEAQKVHRQYLRSEWVSDTKRRKVRGYHYNRLGIAPQQGENPLWKKVFATGDPVYAVLPDENGAKEKAIMAVPISVRGETIGVIHVQEQGEGHIWAEDEIAVVNSVANQVAIALENARLFENTVRRAEREKKVLQITAKIRSTNDPEEMMQIAVSELQQALLATRAQIYVRQEEQDSNHEQKSSDESEGEA
jgi:GAF domain-containing protein/HAMP domain-containing protein